MIHRILRALVAALALCAGTAYAQSLADLAITKTDGVTSVTAGTPVTYTITERLSCHLEHVRNHPLTTRRYYHQMNY